MGSDVLVAVVPRWPAALYSPPPQQPCGGALETLSVRVIGSPSMPVKCRINPQPGE
jgi:hypothetical protein